MKPVLLALAAWAVASAASAQSGSLGGIAVADGRRVRGIAVSAQSSSTQLVRETTTSGSGAYSLPALPSGTYDVTFSLAGHQSVTLRADVREGEQTRLDALLERSEDEESVTRTGGTRSVSERPQLVWSADDAVVESLPLDRIVGDELRLAPTAPEQRLMRAGPVVARAPLRLHRDAVRETAYVFGAPAADLNDATPLIAVPRSGSDELLLARATIAREHGRTVPFHEVTFSAPLHESLWTFVSAAGGPDLKQAVASIDVSPTERDTATVLLLASDADGIEPFGATWTHVRRRFTATGTAGNTVASLNAFAALGRHELAAGAERLDEHVFANPNAISGFVRDRWTIHHRMVIEAGARASDGSIQPRAGTVIDAGGGVRLAAAWSRILDPFTAMERDEAMFSAARAFGATGYARAALVRSDGVLRTDALLIDAQGRYLWFAYGASAKVSDDDGDRSATGAAWLQFDVPVPDYRLSLAAVERWRSDAFDTDFAVRFSMDREWFTPFVGVDVVNAFERDADRVIRASIGFRR